MLFTQTEFIFIFLPVTFVGYFLLAAVTANPLARITWLALASLVFYGYHDLRLLPVIGASIVANYGLGRVIAALPPRTQERGGVFALAVILNLGALAYYKYANFGISLFDHFLHMQATPLRVRLPLGISFFTFTQIAYLADVYGGYAAERNFSKYALFVSYFPHLVAGPILHHKEMMPQFGRAARPSGEKIALGLTVFAIGLVKKLLIADGFALIVNPVFGQADIGAISTIDAWGGAFAYSLQIYFDFSGYSDMAIGLSLLFGIVLPFNFDAPYKARSISEFWRRWHITLSRFLRDYLYIPLGGNRRGAARRTVNIAVTMLLGGLWHGAGATFVIWGALHGTFLLVHHAWVGLKTRRPALAKVAATLPFAIVALVLTQLAVVVAWVYFRADGVHAATRMLAAMGHLNQPRATLQPAAVTQTDLMLIALGYIACLTLPNVNAIFARWHIGIEEYPNERPWSILRLSWHPTIPWAVAASGLLLAGVAVAIAEGGTSPFLYFQF